MVDYKKLILEKESGKKAFLLGNEAIVRGALEADIAFFAAYPGTPSSEILDAFSSIAKDTGVYVEVSSNEKVAYEAALGASWSGLRSMTSMKHVGLNVAADAFMSSVLNGVGGGFVAVVADDPSMWSSQNEQDTRVFAKFAGVPVIEPSSPDEARALTKKAFELSEALDIPIVLRTTTRLSHMRGEVELGRLPESIVSGKRKTGGFSKQPERFVNLPSNARRLRLSWFQKIDKAKRLFSEGINKIEGPEDSKVGIIASGLSYAYVKEALAWLKIKEVKILKLLTPYPLPEGLLDNFFNGIERAIIIEELEPVVEEQVKAWAYDKGLRIPISGKDLVPRYFELTTERVVSALSKLLNVPVPVDFGWFEAVGKEAESLAPPRPPTLCPACPHRNTFYAIKRAASPRAIFPSDIGCYTLSYYPPIKAVDTCIEMGASVGIAHGISKAMEKKESKVPIIATIGDSTFFHAGLPSLANAIYNNSKFVLVVLDNRTTAMTGHQPHPGTGISISSNGKEIKIEDVARALGASYVAVVDPYDIKSTEKAIKEAINSSGVAVVVARRECSLMSISEKVRKGEQWKKYHVVPDLCTGCRACINAYGCPAIGWDPASKKAYINEELCWGCGGCAQVCPYDAISEVKKL